MLRAVVLVVLTLCLFVVLAVPAMFAFAGGPAGDGEGADGRVTGEPSDEVVDRVARRAEIPRDAVRAYLSAAAAKPEVDWTILAGIGKRECDHGRSRLTGCRRGTANFCGARGPMQFLGNTWRRGTDAVRVGRCPGVAHFTGDPVGPPIPEGSEGQGYATDGDDDGVADPWEWFDATHAAARYLVDNGLRDDVRRALLAYNGRTEYVNGVLANARRYREATGGIDLTAGNDDGATGGGRGAGGGAAGGCPLAPRGSTEPHVDRGNTRATQAMADAVVGCFGREYAVYCEGARATGEHPRGRACDFMLTSGGRPDPARRAHGRAMAEWIAEHADDLHLLYVIWDDRIWNPSRDARGIAGSWDEWRDYRSGCRAGRGDPSACHYNHVHVSVKLRPGDPASAGCGSRRRCDNT